MKFLSIVLLSASVSVSNAFHTTVCPISKPVQPADNPPYTYVIGQGNGLDKYLCKDSHLATFEVEPGPGCKLEKAVLTASAWDIDPTEDNNLIIDNAIAGPMVQGGNDCWSLTTLDVTNLITLGGTHEIHIDVDTAGGWCVNTDWISLTLTYDNGVCGDPHFKTWGGEPYDFHGVCDLVLLSNPQFKNNLGLDIHIRTEKTRMWSYVSAVSVRIGDQTLEVAGGATENNYWINGETSPELSGATISGHVVSFEQVSPKSQQFVIDLGDGTTIHIKTWNAYVGVSVKGATSENFGSSVGLMGAFPHGKKLARDSATNMDDPTEFGQEWQVLATEPKLFHETKGPQAPQQCEIPSSAQMRRRLGESLISKQNAELACSRVSEEDFDLCVFDVMATNDKDAAGAY